MTFKSGFDEIINYPKEIACDLLNMIISEEKKLFHAKMNILIQFTLKSKLALRCANDISVYKSDPFYKQCR